MQGQHSYPMDLNPWGEHWDQPSQHLRLAQVQWLAQTQQVSMNWQEEEP